MKRIILYFHILFLSSCYIAGRYEDKSTLIGLSVLPYYEANGKNWNDYVKKTGSTSYDATGVSCTALTDTKCIHAGEVRKFIVPGYTGCAGLTASDSAGAFTWECVEGSNPTLFRTKELNVGKKLSDLVTETGWKPIVVKVYVDGTLIAQSSEPASWWQNTVAVLPDNTDTNIVILDGTDDDGSGPDQAYAEGTIFVLGSNRTSPGYNINIDKAALVTLGTYQLTFKTGTANNCDDSTGEATSPTNKCLIMFGNQNYIWIEGTYSGNDYAMVTVGGANFYFSKLRGLEVKNAASALVQSYNGYRNEFSYINASKSTWGNNGTCVGNYLSDFNVYHHILCHGSTYGFVWYNGSDDNIARDILVANNELYGFYIQNSNRNIATRLQVFNNRNLGVVFHSSAKDNILTNIVTTNNGNTGVLVLSNSRFNTLAHITSVNNSATGFSISGTGNQKNYVSQLLAVNNGASGITLANGAFTNYFYNTVATNNNAYGVRIFRNGGTDPNNNFFYKNLLVGNNTTNSCFVENTTTGNNIDLNATTCTNSDPLLDEYNGKTNANSFVGITRSDSLNQNITSMDSSGFLNYTSLTDWFNFEVLLFRSWGKGASTSAIVTSNRSYCDTGNCALWDWRLKSTATDILNYNGTLTANAACPSSVSGSQTITDGNSVSPNTYLVNAIEIFQDDIGDDDGLCETGESCIFAPHFGAYMGEGSYSQTCTFTNGTVSNVRMYGYSTQYSN